MAIFMQGDKYPGEEFSLTINMADEMNQSASGFLQLDTIQVNSSADFSDISAVIVTVFI